MNEAAAPPPALDGLSSAEVAERVARGEVNAAAIPTSRTVAQIVRANVFTRFNALLGSMFVIILIIGPLQDALFGAVLIMNALVGIVQEVRAKRTLDRLTLLAAPTVTVRRDGRPAEIRAAEVVRGDLVALTPGDQVVADGTVVIAEELEVDESLLTGEADPEPKAPGDELLSGSFASAGTGWYRADAVGAEAYAHRLAAEARAFSLARSELREGINRILVLITWAIPPVAALLFTSQLLSHDTLPGALRGTVAGLVGMIPEGLILLTSITFALSVIRLGRRQVLVQELAAVEGLARVDVVCFDKTGTLTEGGIELDSVDAVDGHPDDVRSVLAALAAAPGANATLAAVGAAVGEADEGWEREGAVPFSSARKWSAAAYRDRGTWILGAPEIVLPDGSGEIAERAAAFAAEGRRVIALCYSAAELAGETLPGDRRPAALVTFRERLRPDATDALRFFAAQGVAAKVVSGDNPVTVAALARSAGMDVERAVDARLTDPASVAEETAVFGRVVPHQKQELVKALQNRGHTVAMTGDGVNDVLAVKTADLGVALGSGAAVTRAVARLVLLNGQFSTLPVVVAEGRRVIANVERVANLFLTKTVYATLLVLATTSVRWEFPFLPRHLTLVGGLTIGIPGFFLTFERASPLARSGMVRRVLRFAVPVGFTVAAGTFGAYGVARVVGNANLTEARTTATLVLGSLGLVVLASLVRPFNPPRLALVATMSSLLATAPLLPAVKTFFELDLPSPRVFSLAALIAAVAGTVIVILSGVVRPKAGTAGPRLRRRTAPRGEPSS